MKTPRSSHKAFTLIELLVVIAIIAILIALLVPAVQKVREAASRIQCANNLKNIGLAIHNYHDANKSLPPTWLHGAGGATWMVLILPYVEQDNLYKQWDIARPYYNQPKAAAIETPVPVYFCPSRRPPTLMLSKDSDGRGPIAHRPGALGDYAANGGNGDPQYWWRNPLLPEFVATQAPANGIMLPAITSIVTVGVEPRIVSFSSRTRFASVTDGTSNTLLVGEKHVPPHGFGQGAFGDSSAYNADWPSPAERAAGPGYPLARFNNDTDLNFDFRFGSYHPGICQFVMADGRVVQLKSSISTSVLGALATRNGGEVVANFE